MGHFQSFKSTLLRQMIINLLLYFKKMEMKHSSTTSEKNHEESISECSSARKTKVIRKCTQRKRITKIVHNFCVHYTKPNGEAGFITHKKILEITQEDDAAVKAIVQKGVETFNSTTIQEHYSSFPTKQEQKVELPLPAFNPQLFMSLMCQNSMMNPIYQGIAINSNY